MAIVIDQLVAELGFSLSADSLNQFEGIINRFGHRVENRMKRVAGTMARGIAQTAAAIAPAKIFADYEHGMATIEGLVGVHRSTLKGWDRDLERIGKRAGVMPKAMVDTTFFITSAGMRGKAALDLLDQSARGAAAGMGEQATLAKLATDAVSAYGKEAITTGKAMDVLAAGIRLGKFEDPRQVAPQAARVMALAQERGVQFSEVMGLMASMSLRGHTPERSATMIENLLREFTEPKGKMEELLKGTGLDFSEMQGILAQGSGRGIPTVLQLLEGTIGRDSLAEAFGSELALSGALDILGPALERTNQILDETANSTGSLDRAWEAVSNTIKTKWNSVSSNLRFQLKEIGAILAPLVKRALDLANRVIDTYARMPKFVKVGIASFLAIGPAMMIGSAGIWTMSIGLGKLLSLFLLASAAGKIAATVMGTIYSPVGEGARMAVRTTRDFRGAMDRTRHHSRRTWSRMRRDVRGYGTAMRRARTPMGKLRAFGRQTFALFRNAGRGAFRAIGLSSWSTAIVVIASWTATVAIILGAFAAIAAAIAGLAWLFRKDIAEFFEGALKGIERSWWRVELAMRDARQSLEPLADLLRQIGFDLDGTTESAMSFGDRIVHAFEVAVDAVSSFGNALAHAFEPLIKFFDAVESLLKGDLRGAASNFWGSAGAAIRNQWGDEPSAFEVGMHDFTTKRDRRHAFHDKTPAERAKMVAESALRRAVTGEEAGPKEWWQYMFRGRPRGGMFGASESDAPWWRQILPGGRFFGRGGSAADVAAQATPMGAGMPIGIGSGTLELASRGFWGREPDSDASPNLLTIIRSIGPELSGAIGKVTELFYNKFSASSQRVAFGEVKNSPIERRIATLKEIGRRALNEGDLDRYDRVEDAWGKLKAREGERLKKQMAGEVRRMRFWKGMTLGTGLGGELLKSISKLADRSFVLDFIYSAPLKKQMDKYRPGWRGEEDDRPSDYASLGPLPTAPFVPASVGAGSGTANSFEIALSNRFEISGVDGGAGGYNELAETISMKIGDQVRSTIEHFDSQVKA